MPLLCLKHGTPSLTGGMLRETCPRAGISLRPLHAFLKGIRPSQPFILSESMGDISKS
ncbi:hypothetical protein SLEP1_g9985 [Rubroshorea leprosula]|uniref:Uncharacterized protein n=1 Tax=Rubroshorea leprosula TaxID=152421 RepID=A0AAV5ICK9_9ROSI|nr:hypothetical protein SLEP1_g9985 [Rubroshorea leprosula]